jgi:hypothetical protein
LKIFTFAVPFLLYQIRGEHEQYEAVKNYQVDY